MGQTYEVEIQAAHLSLAHKQKQFPGTTPSEGELQAASGLSCSPTLAHEDELAAITYIATLEECSFHPQSLSDIYPAQADGSYTNPDSFLCPSVDCIQECLDTPDPNGIQHKLALPRPKPKPRLSLKKDVPSWSDVPKLQKDVPPWPNVPRPQPRPRLSLKRTSKVHDSPDTISHQDSPVPAIGSEDVYCACKCTPTLSDSDLGVNDEVVSLVL